MIDYINFFSIVPFATISLLAIPINVLTNRVWPGMAIAIISIILLINQIVCFILKIKLGV